MIDHIIPYGKQSIDDSDIEAVVEALKDPLITQGPRVKEFEEAFAKYVECKYAVAVANGTAALHLSALTLMRNKKQKVLVTPLTFAASANCILYCGGTVEFVDIDSDTWLIDINLLEKKLASEPEGTYQGIIPVDFAGRPVNTEKIRRLADKYNLWILEDACHAPGGGFTDSSGAFHKCGNGYYADLSIFSFHPVKHIAAGEGGMVTTNNQELYNTLLKLRTHGITKNQHELHENHGGWYHEMQLLGYNYRIPDILCALGNSQLQKAEKNLILRQEIAKRYDEAFKGSVIKFMEFPGGINHAYHLYIILINNRRELYNKLREMNIYTQVHYIPVYKHPYYQSIGFKKEICPNAEAYYERCLSLPMYPSLSESEQDYVIDNILKFAR